MAPGQSQCVHPTRGLRAEGLSFGQEDSPAAPKMVCCCSWPRLCHGHLVPSSKQSWAHPEPSPHLEAWRALASHLGWSVGPPLPPSVSGSKPSTAWNSPSMAQPTLLCGFRWDIFDSCGCLPPRLPFKLLWLVSVSWGCCNKVPQIRQLKTTVYSPTVAVSRHLKPKCGQAHPSSEGSGEDPPWFLLASGGSRWSLAGGRIPPTSASTFASPSSPISVLFL